MSYPVPCSKPAWFFSDFGMFENFQILTQLGSQNILVVGSPMHKWPDASLGPLDHQKPNFHASAVFNDIENMYSVGWIMQIYSAKTLSLQP